MGYTIKEGNYEQYGVQMKNGGVIFTFEAEKEDDCSVLFYDKDYNVTEEIAVPDRYCRGAIRSICVEGLRISHLKYNYRINGRVVTDPYANRIVGRERWNDSNRARASWQVCGGYLSGQFDWQEDVLPEVPRREMVMYKVNIRGFSMDAGIRGSRRGSFAAFREKIPYLKELGITTVEFMPVYEFEEKKLPKQKKLPEYLKWQTKEGDMITPEEIETSDKVNLWGYVPGNYFAVKASYAGGADPALEWKELVRQLHANGMECVMEMYFTGNENQNMILDALRYWVREYHVDGFHLLGDKLPITQIAQDAWLRRTKIFYTEYEAMLLERKCSYPHLFVYSDEYLYPVRAILNHVNGSIEAFACQQRKQNRYHGFVNYIADNNGFTLHDLFCYVEKHNQANGEDNCDGNNWNLSSNYGVEGRCMRRVVRRIRERQMCNAIAILMLGQGVPLLFEGDELGNSQEGNNNAYCQDNRIGWVNWKKGGAYEWLTDFTREMIAFRKAHPVLAAEEPKTLSDAGHKGLPDLSYHGESAWISALTGERQSVGMLYCGAYVKRWDGTPDDDIYVGYNFHTGTGHLALPKLPGKRRWHLCMDTARGAQPFLPKEELVAGTQIAVKGQSVVILVGK